MTDVIAFVLFTAMLIAANATAAGVILGLGLLAQRYGFADSLAVWVGICLVGIVIAVLGITMPIRMMSRPPRPTKRMRNGHYQH